MIPQSSHACGNVSVVLSGAYRELLTAAAGSAAALTGLLFVALSVAPRSQVAGYPAVIREVRAAASLLSFTNVLVVSLFGLVPGTNAGYPALVSAMIGVLFTAAGIRSIVTSSETTRVHLRAQAGLFALLLLTFGFELGGGLQLLAWPASTGGAQTVCYVLVGLMLIGIARAWELVGDRDTGILASILVLAGRDSRAGDDAAANQGAPPPAS
jgi:hypothetical protein